MYEYRTMTPEQRRAVVEERRRRGFPWHGPPHPEAAEAYRIVTAACYEHRRILNSPERLQWFEESDPGAGRSHSSSCQHYTVGWA
jgi:putative transposase